ncbi:hypothetical protein FZC76_18775 [Sutcliffiella horikoshii]|uniref:Uncharacterized protein n=1 Tax=Sutcliffiella horikoshii TaxID=79883 RepID=A0A5D4SQI0_9BACI|nr:hypothetical protein [Sutcliffiella horikoshii]TYS64604.1 hypothetical protein FZC76_18775 [Sutcliffiella horikoshii]
MKILFGQLSEIFGQLLKIFGQFLKNFGQKPGNFGQLSSATIIKLGGPSTFTTITIGPTSINSAIITMKS